MADDWRSPPKRIGKLEPLELLDTGAGAIICGIVALALVLVALWWFGWPAR